MESKIAVTRSKGRIRSMECKQCYGYMHGVEKYMCVGIYTFTTYDKSIPAMFAWNIKQSFLLPLIEYIEKKAIDEHFLSERYCHNVQDLLFINRVCDIRHAENAYYFMFPLAEYEYLFDILINVYHFYDNDQYIYQSIHKLLEMVIPNVQSALNGGDLRPCTCGSCVLEYGQYIDRLIFTYN